MFLLFPSLEQQQILPPAVTQDSSPSASDPVDSGISPLRYLAQQLLNKERILLIRPS